MKNLQKTILIAMLTAVATVLFFFSFPIIPSISMLKMDFSDIPAIVGGVLINPIAGVIIQLLKNFIYLIIKGMGSNMGFGNLMNLLVGTAYVLPYAIIVRKMRGSLKGFVIAALVATAAMLIVGFFANYIISPPYFRAFSNKGIGQEEALAFAIGSTMFNAIKAGIISVFMAFIMKYAIPPLKKIVDKASK